MQVTTVTIVGGHGEIALRLAHLLSHRYRVVSIVRKDSQFRTIRATGATPVLLDLEHSHTADWTHVFDKYHTDVVVFAAGAGGGAWREHVKSVDYAGAVKVFDAIERMRNPARLLLLSSIDSRPEDHMPEHYDRQDILASRKYRDILGNYLPYKYEADRNLWHRHTFRWTIVRPGWLSDSPGTSTAEIGTTHITHTVSRDDVAQMLALLVERPDAAGLALDIVGGEEPISTALDDAIKHHVTNTY